MSPLAIIICILSGLFVSPLQTGSTGASAPVSHLEIVLTNLRAPEGSVQLGLYNSAAGWASGQAVEGASVSADATEVRIRIENLEPGTYGIKVFHDRDGDGGLNTGLFGIPSEPFAFSNNARGRMGPADWTDASFIIAPGENEHTIRLR